MFFFFKQKTAYEMRISDWSSDVCSSDLVRDGKAGEPGREPAHDLRLGTIEIDAYRHAQPLRRAEQRRHVAPVAIENAGIGKPQSVGIAPIGGGLRLRIDAVRHGQDPVGTSGIGRPVIDRKSTRLHTSHKWASRIPSSA